MIKKELIETVARKTGFDKEDIDNIIDAIISTIKKEIIAKNEVKLKYFGTFGNKKRKAKICNFESMKGNIIKEAYVPIFKPSKELKEKINK